MVGTRIRRPGAGPMAGVDSALAARVAQLTLARQSNKMGRLPEEVVQRLASMGAATLVVPLPEDWPVIPRPPQAPLTAPPLGRFPLDIRPGPGGGQRAVGIQPPPAPKAAAKARGTSRGRTASTRAARRSRRARSAKSALRQRRAVSVQARLRLQRGDELGLEKLQSRFRASGERDSLPVDAVVDHFAKRGLFDGGVVTPEMARGFLDALADGSVETTFVCEVEVGMRKGEVGRIQAMSLIAWVAERKGITFAECVAGVINRGRQMNFEPQPVRRRRRSKRGARPATPIARAPVLGAARASRRTVGAPVETGPA